MLLILVIYNEHRSAGFNELDNAKNITVSYLLCLQHRSDEWDKFWNKV